MEKKRSSKINNFLFIGIYFLLYCIIFFTIKNKLLFTPDFGESDAYHLNLSLKYFLAQNLRQGKIPFWTNQLQGGYPLFSEGQIGTLFLPNLLFFKFLNFPDAYNLVFVFSLFLISSGFYLLLREFKVKALISLLLSLIFTFSGTISLRWVHINLIQSFSLTPLLCYVLIKYFNSKKKSLPLIATLVISQIIFAGHLQIVFISLFALFLFCVVYLILKKKSLSEISINIVFLFFIIISGFILSLSQILPTFLLTQNSSRLLSLDYNIATSFPFTWAHLISYFTLYYFGSPKLGTYPPYSNDWGIFWENTPYLGWPLFLLMFTSLIITIKKNFSKKLVFFGLLLTIFFIFLALGKNSPFYFIFSFFPFNSFRTPSKYLLATNFFLVFTAGIIINNLYLSLKHQLSKIILIILLLFNIVILIKFTFNYQLFLNKDIVLSTPKSSNIIDNNSLYLTLGQGNDWNDVFLNKGWLTENSINNYLFFKNYLYQNSNLLFGKKIFNINTGTFKLRRPEYLKDLVEKNISLEDKKTIIIDRKLQNLLEIIGIRYIISSLPIQDDAYKLLTSLQNNKYKIFIYKDSQIGSELFYVPKKIKKITFLNEFTENYQDDKISLSHSLIEDIPFAAITNNEKYSLSHIETYGNNLKIKGSFKNKTFFVLQQNYYPEWSVYIDGKRTSIYKTNLIHIGFFIPKGTHDIELRYENFYFKLGLVISFMYLLLFIFILFKLKRL